MNKPQLEKLKKQEMSIARRLLKKQNDMLGQSISLLDHLIYLQKSISLLSSDEINRVLAEKLPYILSIKYFTLFLYDKNTRRLRLASHNHAEIDGEVTLHINDSEIMSEAVKTGRYILEQDFQSSRFYKGVGNLKYQCGFFISIPLMIEDEIIGVLNLNDNEKGAFEVSDLDFALSVSEFIALSISNAGLYEMAEKLSVTDGLTGLTNHQQMQALLEKEVIRSQRYKSALSLVIMDVDHFKQVNDTHGHQKGDEVLIRIAGIMERVCRLNDVAARYGGEEFILVLPETNGQGAWTIAERLRQEVARQSFGLIGEEFKVTISCGISELGPNGTGTPKDLIKLADQALYKAKSGGRNQTVRGKGHGID